MDSLLLEVIIILVLVFIKFSNSIDRPRQDKFSQFFRALFAEQYSALLEDEPRLIRT